MLDEVCTVGTITGGAWVFRISQGIRQKLRATAAQRDFYAIAVIELHQLSSDVATALADGSSGKIFIALPVPIRAVGVSCRGGCMSDPGGADDARRKPCIFSLFEQARQFMFERSRTIAVRGFGTNADDTHPCLFAGDDCGHRAGAVGHLAVRVVGFHQRDVGKGLKGEDIFLTRTACCLSHINPCSRDRGDAHAVA